MSVADRNETVCIIPARGGSRGIPNKNIVEFEGKPLLAWSIACAKSTQTVDRVIVSTDSEKIATIAHEWGAEVLYPRPSKLATDEVHAVHVVLHALDWLEQGDGCRPDGVMMLLPTSPLRLPADIDGAIELFYGEKAASVVSVVDLGKYLTNLRFVEGHKMIRVAPDENPNAQRQGLKKLFAVNGSIFVARPDVLKSEGTFHVSGALAYVMDGLNSIDVNSSNDLLLARKIASAFEPWRLTKQ